MTRVIFRVFLKDGSVIAVFPDEVWNNNGNLTSYMHVGQYGPCSPNIASVTRLATEAEYAPLLKELQEHSDLRICKRIKH